MSHIEALKRDPTLPYLNPEISGASLTREFQPVLLPSKTWVAIADLPVVQALTQGLKAPFPHDVVGKAQADLLIQAHRIFGDQMAVVAAEDLCRGITGLVDRHMGTNPNALVISFDPVYTPDLPDLSITRMIGLDNEVIGRGPRPGFPPLSKQIDQIIQKYPGIKEVSLVDEVLFSAGSILCVAEEFENRGIKVASVIAGVARTTGVERLKKRGLGVQALVVALNPRDIVDVRDLVAGVPLGGRVVGTISDEGCAPLVDKHGIPFRNPYLLKHGDPVEWAKIPEEEAQEFSIAGWTTAGVIFEAIGDNLGRDVCLGDLPKAKLPAGYPGPPPKRMQGRGLNPDIPILQVIEHKRGKVAGVS